MINNIKTATKGLDNKIHYISNNNLERIYGLNNIEAIFVDCSSFFSGNEIKKIYDVGISFQASQKYFYFIFLQ